jgi:DNA-binding protein Fis
MNIEDKTKELLNQDEENIYHVIMNEVEKKIISTTLVHTRGNQSEAALMLGICRGTLSTKIKRINKR